MRTLLVILLTLALVTGCSRNAKPPEEPPVLIWEPAEPPAPAAAPAVSVVPARSLFPTADIQLQYYVEDGDDGPQRPVTEELLIEPGRAVAVANSLPYAEWRFQPDGIWREDPATGVLLRYLPAELTAPMVWKQPNGEQAAWFLLERGTLVPHGFTEPPWVLTKLEGASRIAFHFMPGYGVISARALSWREPADGFAKYLRDDKPEPLTQYPDRSRVLALRPAAAPRPAPVQTATVAEFEEASRAAFVAVMGDAAALDLDGDGKPEFLGAPPGQWVQGPIKLYRTDGTLLYRLQPMFDRQAVRLQPLRLPGIPLQLLLWEMQDREDGAFTYTLLYLRNGQVEMACGWMRKAQFGVHHRLEIAPDGGITAYWHMGDPARHTRVTRYKPQYRDGGVWVEPVSVTYPPEGAALTSPSEPRDLLQAAFIARWFGLKDELPRYFATPEAAAPLAEHKELHEPWYGPGEVRLGMVKQPLPTDPTRYAEVVPGEMGPDGWAPFVAFAGFYESGTHIWGRVRFSRNPDGQWVIAEIIFDGIRSAGI